ncbi:MAG: stage V sporulation protein R [Candidatus Paceibacteria bacterium]|jgi:stage V sporulation protein R
MVRTEPLPADLRKLNGEIERIAQDAGLDFFPVIFELLDARDVNALAAYTGFPVRYPSWRFGMEFERLEKGYSWGLSKIYELVINNDPTYAYLVRSNSPMEQKLVMAHVFGHADFFKHNHWFQPTERHMVDVMAANGTRVRRYIDIYGQDKVESFLDQALALDTLIDPYLPLRQMRKGAGPSLTPLSPLERAKRSFEAASGVRQKPLVSAQSEMPLPTLDVLGFLASEADLCDWQRDILEIVRTEAYYFVPQRMTKILNEGWASFWHSRIMTRSVLGAADIIDFADCHSGATASQPGQLNPYKLGIDLFRYAESQGRDLFRLRAVHNDVSFIDAVVDEEFAQRSNLFLYDRNPRTGRMEVADRDWRAIKNQLLASMAGGGVPQIVLIDGDYGGCGELLLQHRYDGRDLQLDQAGETLKGIARLWKKPCHLLTEADGEGLRLSSDGEEIKRVETAEKADDEGHADPDSAERQVG